MDKKKRKRSVIVLIIFLCLFIVVFGVLFKLGYIDFSPDETDTTSVSQSVTQKSQKYKSPINFRSLKKKNPDIYAWIEIPSLDIAYPVLQNSDDTKYLRRDINEKYDIKGSLFTESKYNGTDFSDPLTIIYGHSMPDGTMFGKLQGTYSTEDGMKANSEVIVYLPESELHYKVFAAVPYDNRHILYNYDFTNKRIFRIFFMDIMSIRSLGAAFDSDVSINTDDKVLVLSTCLLSDRNKRFLVFAKLADTGIE